MSTLPKATEITVMEMLEVEDPSKLERNGFRPLMARLERIDELCQKSGGRLVSRQIIGKEIMDWEDEV